MMSSQELHIRVLGGSYLANREQAKRCRNPASSQNFQRAAAGWRFELILARRNLVVKLDSLDRQLARCAEHISPEGWRDGDNHAFQRYQGLETRQDEVEKLFVLAETYLNGEWPVKTTEEYVAVTHHDGEWWCQRKVMAADASPSDSDEHIGGVRKSDATSYVKLVKELREDRYLQPVWLREESGWRKIA